jgi:Uma2 family endonuclease
MSQRTSPDLSIPIIPVTPRSAVSGRIPPLEAGDHLDQTTFHERYCAMPENFRAELIEGMVIVPSPLRIDHGETHTAFQALLYGYKVATPGTNAVDNVATILGEESEPQPDGALYVRPEFGGQSQNVDGYVVGSPELLGEISSSSQAYDLHSKYRDYERSGVLEYVVILLREQSVRWFARRDDRFEPLTPDSSGVFRSQVFPGLWLDSAALFRDDGATLMETLQLGLQSAEHAAFVKELQARGSQP